MKRRDLLVGAGVVLAAVAANRAEAAPSAAKPSSGSLVLAANSCVRASQACLRHCLDMLATGNVAMAACAKSVADLIPASEALAAIAAGSSRHTAALAAVVGQIARDCKAECDKHLAMGPCKACAESCAALIAEVGKA
ncbi:MAG: four-helix bundle copper-binding protein [Polyangia bacterium]